jgi:hypothetical protein
MSLSRARKDTRYLFCPFDQPCPITAAIGPHCPYQEVVSLSSILPFRCFFDNLNLHFRQAVEFVDELVDLAVGGFDVR